MRGMRRRKTVPGLPELMQTEKGNFLEIMRASEQEALNMERYLSWQEVQYRNSL